MSINVYSRILDYEVARELINTRIARLSARVAAEEAKPNLDPAVIADFEKQMIDAAIEQELLPGPYD